MAKRTLIAAAAAVISMCAALAPRASDNSQVFGDWIVDIGDSKTFLYAATLNDSGDIFGEYCYFKTKKCNWYVWLHNICKKEATYPILANSDSSAAPLYVQCTGGPLNNLYAEEFTDWKTLEGILADSIHIGFAVPIAEDKFSVVRFSLKGRTDATTFLEAAFSKAAQGGTQGTTDSIL